MSQSEPFRLALLAGSGLPLAGGGGVSDLDSILPWAMGAGFPSTLLKSQGT